MQSAPQSSRVAQPGERSAKVGGGDGTTLRAGVGRLLREPLVHFIVLGGALFVVSGAPSRDPAPNSAANRIELTLDDLQQLQIGFAAKWQRAPTPQELVALVEGRVREEILYREALALGLDRNDTIVKRRMAQKMEFFAEDVSALREPTPEELRAWYGQHSERFGLPARVTFRHLYFSPDRRGGRAREDAERALVKLAGKPESRPDAAGVADPFMFQDWYGDRTAEQLAREFGPDFARAIFGLAPGSWQGPIESGHGPHLVFVDSLTPGREPAFEEVELAVADAWRAEQRADSLRKAYEEMRAKYEVVLPAPPDEGP